MDADPHHPLARLVALVLLEALAEQACERRAA
jgi:hypothetical protein